MFAQWSTCMRAAGYHYATPFDAAADPRWLNATEGQAATGEIQVAERDVTCKLSVNVIGVEFTVQSGYENSLIAAHSSTLDGVRTAIETESCALSNLMTQYGT